jgi:glucan-binding YG repeat protein
MVEVERKMFGQSEKEEIDPSEEIIVLYCDEHQEEAKKSPYLFTEAERVAHREHKEKKYNEELAREKQEREERLNNQKNLFYCEGRTDENKDKLKYAAFLGKENGQKYYLMVPSDHLI